MTDRRAIALAELTRRRAVASDAVRGGKKSRTEAEAHIRLWCGIAAWFCADLPADLCVFQDTPAHWLDYCGPDQSCDDWLRACADELRRATNHAITRADAEPGKPDLNTRARGLLTLDRAMYRPAGLPPLGAEPLTERKAA